MKLIAASAALLASTYSAQTIETLIGQLIDTVYQHDPVANTYTFNVSPYWNAVYTCKGSGFSGEGTYGNGNGVIDFTEEASWTDTSFNFNYSQSGQMKSHPWNEFFAVPENRLEDHFDGKMSFSVNTQGIKFSESGIVNNHKIENSLSLSIDSVAMTKNKMSAQLKFNRKTDYPSNIDEFYKNWLLPKGSTSVTLSASAKNACSENPLSTSCTAKVTVTGEHNDNDIGTSVAKYSVQPKKAQLQVRYNDEVVFWMGLAGIDKFDVLSLKYKLGPNGKAVLVFQVAGPNGFENVVVAAGEFFEPFDNFLNAIGDMHDAARIVAYFDKVAATWENKLFNVYPILEATKFESDLLKEHVLGGQKVQRFLKDMSNTAADMIVGYGQTAGSAVTGARSYLNELTGAVGEAKFDAWFAKL